MKLRKVLFRIFLAVFIVAVACIIGILVRDHKQNVKDQNLRDKAAVTSENDTEMSVDAEENTTIQIPVDFATLQEENPDIFAYERNLGEKKLRIRIFMHGSVLQTRR